MPVNQPDAMSEKAAAALAKENRKMEYLPCEQ